MLCHKQGKARTLISFLSASQNKVSDTKAFKPRFLLIPFYAHHLGERTGRAGGLSPDTLKAQRAAFAPDAGAALAGPKGKEHRLLWCHSCCHRKWEMLGLFFTPLSLH